MTAAENKVLDALEVALREVNGQDAYSVTALSLGVLKREEYLVLPDYMDTSAALGVVPPENVGRDWANSQSDLTFEDFVHIYALNKEVGKDTKDPVMFALIRAEAVKMGWFVNQAEVRYAPVTVASFQIYAADATAISDGTERARTAAYLVPMMTENVFRTTGHHYLTGMADEYERKYQALCSACLVPDLSRILRAGELWHKVLHWIGPQQARSVMVSHLGGSLLPNAIAIRLNAAPAGTAIITTTAAVIDAMKACNWAKEVEAEGGFNFKKILDASKAIAGDVTRYHTAYFAYGVTPLTDEETAIRDEASAEAIRFAPCAQGFIEAMYSDSSLARAKALRKHAEANPGILRRAMRVFRHLSRADAETIRSIFHPEGTTPMVAQTQAPATPLTGT
jgi:hypothetical protein